MQEWGADRVFCKILKALAEDLRKRDKIDLTEAFTDGTRAGAPKGALSSELLAVASQQRSWQSLTVTVFQSPLGSVSGPSRKLSSSRERSAAASSAVVSHVASSPYVAPRGRTVRAAGPCGQPTHGSQSTRFQ